METTQMPGRTREKIPETLPHKTEDTEVMETRAKAVGLLAEPTAPRCPPAEYLFELQP